MLRASRSSPSLLPGPYPSAGQSTAVSVAATPNNEQAKYAYTGYNLLQISASDFQHGQLSQQDAFPRQVYVDSLSYLLQGLPADLTDEEIRRIRHAIPLQIEADLSLRDCSPGERDRPDATLLQRVLSSAVVLVCLILRYLLPYIRHLLISAYQFEQTHKFSQRVFTSFIGVTDSAAKGFVRLASTVLGHDVVMKGMVYVVDGVRMGLADGIGQGLRIIENSSR